MKRFVLCITIAGATLVLSACGSSSSGVTVVGGGTGTTTPPATGTTPLPLAPSSFGAGFAAFFAADPNSDARTPAATDVPALNTTADPLG